MKSSLDPEAARFRHPDALGSIEFDDGFKPAPPQPGVQPGRMPRPPRRGLRFFRRFVVFIIVAGLLAAALYVGYIGSIVAKISTNPVSLSGLSADASGRTNVLVLGVGDSGHAGEQLSDSMMLLSFQNGQVAQVSIPRDLRVQIPGHGSGKINSANVYGGVELAAQTVSNTFDVPINYYVKTNFSGLAGMVDAVGGIDVDVKERLADPEYPCADNQYKSCGLVIEPGLQHMDGARALEYVRCRKGTCGNDFGRAARQQEVIGLLKAKLTDVNLLWHPRQLALVAEAARQGIETDIGFIQMLQLAKIWQSAGEPKSLVLSTAPGGLLRSASGSSDLVPVGGDFSAIAETIDSIFSAQTETAQ